MGGPRWSWSALDLPDVALGYRFYPPVLHTTAVLFGPAAGQGKLFSAAGHPPTEDTSPAAQAHWKPPLRDQPRTPDPSKKGPRLSPKSRCREVRSLHPQRPRQGGGCRMWGYQDLAPISYWNLDFNSFWTQWRCGSRGIEIALVTL